ncbi:GH92 family glycosyl hydrolase [Novipirellula artificiosorum]|uniref:Glycosyl hydrolase family 92 n=1 Tax=Novipirellula artificiosorum TaxID=2528016 RepID=A0A5C6DAD5_9BACT|nr:GH92 family glycosyl hydrolase [Novipirellula artificiosorum]TWU31799.1 Glycosyl hydrolase family 92 [Novipirellula artificiosorum]
MRTSLSLLLFLVFAIPAHAQQAARSRVAEVNPFLGTGGHGHTFPGATTPYAMVQLSPDTRTLGWDACGGYHFSDSSILGFSHTHLSGTGIGDRGDVLFMPFVGDVQTKPGTVEEPDSGYRSRFSHHDEDATPGYYRVRLQDDDIEAELTATQRAGFHRYTFPTQTTPSLIIDLAHTIHGHANPITEFRAINDHEIEGYKRSRGWAQNHHVYFHAKFSQPFTCTLFENGNAKPGKWAVASGNTQAVLRFENADTAVLMAKVGISAVDYQGARNNVETEISDWDFDAVKEAACEAWETQLSKINVKGGSADARTIFYTSLYHTAISPNLFTDCDGRYRGVDQQIHTSTDGPLYTVFSLWDTFRAFHPLMTMTEPERDADFIRTLLTHYDQGGSLPKWELDGNYTGTMIGYHAVPVIVDAYQKGIVDFDVEKAYQACVQSAHSREDDFLFPSETVREKLNPKAKYYNDTLGFIPCDLENESVSKALEYAYNDWCIAELAEALGKTEDAQKFRERAGRYKQYFDAESGFMRGRNEDGSWKTPFSPKFSQHRKDEYTEGNAWQWTWFAPHDVNGLVDLMGGKAPFVRKLDQLFVEDSSIEGEESSADISGLIGQYAHGNEPSHHITHIYNYVGQAWKTQALVDEILSTLYFNDPNGLSGNEDCGQMSAWYILNAMGFYSFCPGDPTYSIGRPLFDEVVIDVGDGKTFTVRADNNRPANKYIQSARLNGQRLTTPFFSHDDMIAGGTLELTLGEKPAKDAFVD